MPNLLSVKFENYIVAESINPSIWKTKDTFEKKAALIPLLGTYNNKLPYEAANMIYYKDKSLICIDRCSVKVQLRFPFDEPGKQLGVVGFKFIDTNNYYALVIVKD